jgi:flagellar basal body P-ring formation protein FlgA
MIKYILTFALMSATMAAHAAPMLTVITQQVERGSVLTENDITIIDASTQIRRTGTLDAKAIIGMEARRTLAAGQPVYGQDLQKPLMVKRNQLVTLVLSRNGLAIATSGKAMNDGSKGTMVRVQNVSSKQIIEGEVAADGVVRVATLSAPQIPSGF